MQLASIIHNTADRMYEDLRVLQTECISASDHDRKRKLVEFCEIQRHRSLQLLALVKYAENESEVVRVASEGVGLVAQQRLNKYRMSFWAVDNSIRKFEFARAPKYDLMTAVNALVNRDFHGFPEVVGVALQSPDEDRAVLPDSSGKRVKLMQDRILARILKEEIDFEASPLEKITTDDEGQLVMDSLEDGYVIKFGLEEAEDDDDEVRSKWYPTYIRIAVKSGEKNGGEQECRFSSVKHIPLLALQLERHLTDVGKNAQTTREQALSILQEAHRFMRTFCGSLAFQILESQARGTKFVCERKADSFTVKLNADWTLSIRMHPNRFESTTIAIPNGSNSKRNDDFEEASTLTKKQQKDRRPVLSFQLVHKEKSTTPISTEMDGSKLAELSLRRLIAAAVRQTAKHQLEHLRTLILAQAHRHHASQARVWLAGTKESGEFRLDLRLFNNQSALTIKLDADGVLELTTNSPAKRWGNFSCEDSLKMVKHYLLQSPQSVWGNVLADVWTRAEAWDCLASLQIAGLDSHRVALLPPDAEIAQHYNTGTPSSYWNLGCFEGRRYIFAARYVSAPSSFHLSFLPLRQRLVQCTECEIVSIKIAHSDTHGADAGQPDFMHQEQQDETYARRSIDLASIESIHNVYQHVRIMREENASKKMAKYNLHRDESGNWVGASEERISLFEPFALQFKNEDEDCSSSLEIAINKAFFNVHDNDTYPCKRMEEVNEAFDRVIYRVNVLRRILHCNPDKVTIQVIADSGDLLCHCVWSSPGISEAAVLFPQGKCTLALTVMPKNPLQELVLEYWMRNIRDPHSEAFRQGFGLLTDSAALVDAAENYAARSGRQCTIKATNIGNLHFVFDHPEKARKSFECRLDGAGGAFTWGRLGWDVNGRIMSIEPARTVEQVVQSLIQEVPD